MKKLDGAQLAADLSNHPGGYVVLTVRDWDGGPFDLHASIDDDGNLYLPSTEAPAIRLAVRGGSPEALERFANTLLDIAREA